MQTKANNPDFDAALTRTKDYLHADHSILIEALRQGGFTPLQMTYDGEWWIDPKDEDRLVWVETPTVLPYESVKVYFEWSPTAEELEALRFPR